MAIISTSVASEVFHIGWNGGFCLSCKNPIGRIPIAHPIGDPHFGNPISEAYSSPKSYYRFLQGFSGIYNWLYTVRFNTLLEVYNFVITHEFLGVTFIRIGNLHFIYSCQFTQWVALNKGGNRMLKTNYRGCSRRLERIALDRCLLPIFIWPCKFFVAYFDCLRLTFVPMSGLCEMLVTLAGLWALHSVPALGLQDTPVGGCFACTQPRILVNSFYTGDWLSYHGRILTWLGGLKSNSGSLYLRDIAHHHFGVALLFLWGKLIAPRLYKAQAQRATDTPDEINLIMKACNSVHLHVALQLGVVAALVGEMAGPLTPLTPYLYLSYDYLGSLSLGFHHSSIAFCTIIGSLAHGGIFLIREIRQIMR